MTAANGDIEVISPVRLQESRREMSRSNGMSIYDFKITAQ